jgi:hypothetical protein
MPTPAEQQDQNVMKFGEINVEPIAPEIPPIYNEQVSLEESTPESGSDTESYQKNINEIHEYFKPPQFELHQTPLSNDTPEPVTDQNYNNNMTHETTSVPNNSSPSQPYIQPQQYSDYTTQETQQNPSMNQYSEDSIGQGPINKPMFFTSIDREKQRKKGKKPVNPKHKTKQSFFARLLAWLLKWFK